MGGVAGPIKTVDMSNIAGDIVKDVNRLIVDEEPEKCRTDMVGH